MISEDQTNTVKNIISELLGIFTLGRVDFESIRYLLMDLELDFPNECEEFVEEISKITKS